MSEDDNPVVANMILLNTLMAVIMENEKKLDEEAVKAELKRASYESFDKFLLGNTDAVDEWVALKSNLHVMSFSMFKEWLKDRGFDIEI